VAVAGAALRRRDWRQAGSIKRMPRTRLTATTKYTAPKIGHQRAPMRSIQAKRSSQRALLKAGR
jgi:hypothetical protein